MPSSEYGWYEFSATISHVNLEIDATDNTLADGMVLVTHMGDVTGDEKVDISD